MKLLMCAPSHYAIRYEINPWMKIQNRITPAKALAQWKGLYSALRRLGAEVWLVPQKKGCPDMVFTANAGVARGKTFIPSHFRYTQRRGEEPAFIRFFRRKGYAIRDAAKGVFFEGEGDLLPYRDMFFGGFRFRSEIRAHERVSAALGKRLVTLELSAPRFYHLDTCFLPLDEKSALYYPQAFDAYGRKVIRRFVQNPIPVSKEDAYYFACNGIRVGRTVVLNRASRRLKGQLARLGYTTLETPTSEFMKAGGSVKCLLLSL
jgi:N-dimethylarginine dimethylaminohydrolase